MSDYSQTTDFSAKDSLPSGDAEKIILGADVDAELSAISTAIASKVDEPSSPSTNDVLTWNGSAVVWSAGASQVPVGTVVPYAGTSEPTDWLFCDGRGLSQATYSALYAVVGTNYGNTLGGANFDLPDLRFRTVVGPDNMGTAAGAASRSTGVSYSTGTGDEGSEGGAATKTLTTTELPAHTHGAGSYAGPAHTHDLTTSTSNSDSNLGPPWYGNVTSDSGGTLTTASGGGGSVTGTSASAGSGSAYDNMNPFQVLNFIIKYQ